MTLEQKISDLNAQVKIATEQAEQANTTFRELKRRLEEMERFKDEVFPQNGEICVLNPEAENNSCAIMTRYYSIDGHFVLFTIMETLNYEHDDIQYVGQIIDYSEKIVLYGTIFRHDNWSKKSELFDRLLANYAEWRLNL